jgi:hypothetical protein
LETIYNGKKEKYRKLPQERRNTREMPVEIIPIIVSSLRAVYARSLEAFTKLLLCDHKQMKRIGRRRSEAEIMGSMEIL